MSPALSSIRRNVIAGMAVVIFVTFGVGGWAATTDLAGAVVGQGTVVVDSNVKKVQHLTGGVVKELRVRDGDRVKSGDILIHLDETQALTSAIIVEKSLDELLARQARLEAERDNSEQIVFPTNLLEEGRKSDSEASRAVAAERTLFDLREKARGGQKAQLRERAGQLEEEIKGYAGQLDAKQKEVNLIHQELEGVRALWQKNLVPITRLTALERDTARLEGERSQLAGILAETKSKISETQLQIIQIDQDLRTEVGKDLIETRAKIAELTERKTAVNDQLNRTDIRAPQDGRVYQLAVHTLGGVISPSETIMLIVPDNDALAVEVRIAPRDIDQVYVGQMVSMRFEAFNQKTTPEIEGRVRTVSPDLTQDPRTGVSFYGVRVSIAEEDMARLENDKLIPGMPVDVFMRTASRTVLSYLIKPLRDQAMRAFRER